MYIERQYKRYCTVHALNALFGTKIVSCKQMQNFAEKHFSPLFYKSNGYFSIEVLKLWLRINRKKNIANNNYFL